VCWGRDLGALRHPETAREAWLNAFGGVFWILESVGLWPLGPPEFIARAAALGKFGMRVGLCCVGCLSLDVCARSYINWMYGGRGNGRGWIVASHRI
jgi:hypothetical protein